MRSDVRASRTTMVVVVVLCAVTLSIGYLNKARCAAGPFDHNGRSLAFDKIKDSTVCYSDIQYLWLGRGINDHIFPYIHGAITANGVLTGGTVEYPVLSGLLMWLGAIPAHNDAQFLMFSAILLVPFGLVTAWMLGRLAGRSALLWSVGTPLVLYAFHNWELPVVATSVGAVFVMSTRMSLRNRGMAAAALLAVGFCLKLYPGVFVLPLMASVATGGMHGREMQGREMQGREMRKPRFDIAGAAMVAATAMITALAINLPFILGGFQGWRASFIFQTQRQADITTNSIWYWGLRPLFGANPATPEASASAESLFQNVVDVASPLSIFLSFALAVWLGWKRWQRDGTYPWVAVSASMLCGFLLLHKVHSPQYTLWLVPFFVLLKVPWALIGAYLIADLSMGVGVFRYFAALASGSDASTEKFFVEVGVWGRAALLLIFFFVFARSVPRGQSTDVGRAPQDTDLTGHGSHHLSSRG